MNGGVEYGYYSFSIEGQNIQAAACFDERNPFNVFWGADKLTAFTNTGEATHSLILAAGNEQTSDFSDEISVYSNALS